MLMLTHIIRTACYLKENKGTMSRKTWISRLKGTTEYLVDSEILPWGEREDSKSFRERKRI